MVASMSEQDEQDFSPPGRPPIRVKNPLKGLDRSFLADPEQTASSRDRSGKPASEYLWPLGILDFIHADGLDWLQRTMLQTPGDDVIELASCTMSHVVRNDSAASLPRKFARPAGEEQHDRLSSTGCLPSPHRGDLLHEHGIAAGGNRTRRIEVQQKDEEAPERNELRSAAARKMYRRPGAG